MAPVTNGDFTECLWLGASLPTSRPENDSCFLAVLKLPSLSATRWLFSFFSYVHTYRFTLVLQVHSTISLSQLFLISEKFSARWISHFKIGIILNLSISDGNDYVHSCKSEQNLALDRRKFVSHFNNVRSDIVIWSKLGGFWGLMGFTKTPRINPSHVTNMRLL